MSDCFRTCEGCGSSQGQMQCPECIGVSEPPIGIFCSQECFRKNWKRHRRQHHLTREVTAPCSDQAEHEARDSVGEQLPTSRPEKGPNCSVSISMDGLINVEEATPVDVALAKLPVTAMLPTFPLCAQTHTLPTQLLCVVLDVALLGHTTYRASETSSEGTDWRKQYPLASALDILRKCGRHDAWSQSGFTDSSAQLLHTAILSYLEAVQLPKPIIDELSILYEIPEIVQLPTNTAPLSVFAAHKSTIGLFLTLCLHVVQHYIEQGRQIGRRISLEEIDKMFSWTQMGLSARWGPLRKFLAISKCFELQLFPHDPTTVYLTLSSSASSLLISHSIVKLPRVLLAAEVVDSYRSMAVEEVLTHLPVSLDRGVNMGNVGDRLGMKWGVFNLRYEGVLGSSLKRFLLQNPRDFRVEGKLVYRTKLPTVLPVVSTRPRTKRDPDATEADEDLLAVVTAREKKKSMNPKKVVVRASKQDKRRAQNRERFNKNARKGMPRDTRVPGFKPGAIVRKKGRGTKPSMRQYKRNL